MQSTTRRVKGRQEGFDRTLDRTCFRHRRANLLFVPTGAVKRRGRGHALPQCRLASLLGGRHRQPKLVLCLD